MNYQKLSETKFKHRFGVRKQTFTKIILAIKSIYEPVDLVLKKGRIITACTGMTDFSWITLPAVIYIKVYSKNMTNALQCSAADAEIFWQNIKSNTPIIAIIRLSEVQNAHPVPNRASYI